jgi:hypothetical protein
MTAVNELIEYFIKEEKEGCSHWCIHDLIAQLYILKEKEKQQIIDAHGSKLRKSRGTTNYEYWYTGEQYFNETY